MCWRDLFLRVIFAELITTLATKRKTLPNTLYTFQRNVYLSAQSKLDSGPQPSVAFGGIGRKPISLISSNICSKVTTFGSNSTVTLPFMDFAVTLAAPRSIKAFTTLFSQLPQRIPMQSKTTFSIIYHLKNSLSQVFLPCKYFDYFCG